MSDQRTIIVDRAETRSGIPDLLQKKHGLIVEMAELDSGDYVLSEEGGIAVERKDRNDLVGSIMDGRLFPQLAKMKASYERFIYILEGDVLNVRSEIKPEAIRGALSYLSVIEGVAVHHTQDPAGTADMLQIMTRHAQEGLGYEVPMRAGKPKDLRTAMQFLIEGLPGIGPGNAKKLLAYFKTPAAIFAATEADLVKAPGIGKKGAQKVRELLDGSY